MKSNLEHALECARKGWPVFPCRKDTKRPFMTGGFHNATTDEWTITQWWTKWPEAMIGVPMGKASGIWAVDCDGEEGIGQFRELCEKFGRFPETLSQTTPKGGRHYLFRCPAGTELRCSVKKVSPEIDIRADGGYIIVAPSFRLDGKEYAWDNQLPIAEPPSWLVEEAVNANSKTATESRYALAALKAECDKVASSPEGERNDTLNKSSFAIGTLVGGGEISFSAAKDALMAAASHSGLPSSEAENTIDSGLKAGKERPRTSPIKEEPDLLPGNVSVILGKGFRESTYDFESAVDGLFDQGEIVLLNARSGTGKGLITMQLALEMGSVPKNRTQLDFNESLLWGKFRIPKMRRTLFVQAENRPGRTQEKLNQMLAADPSYEAALDNFGYLSFDGYDIRTTGNFMNDRYLGTVMEVAGKHGFDTIIFDPLISYIGADENDNQEVDDSLQRLIEWQKTTNITCILVHHIGKNQGDLDGRGASAIRAKADTLIAFTRDPKRQLKNDMHATVLTGHFQKIRHARDGYTVDFKRDSNGFRLLPMPQEEREQIRASYNERVIEAVRNMGGVTESAASLKKYLSEYYAVSLRTAERWIAEAHDSGDILLAPKKGNVQGYMLPVHDTGVHDNDDDCRVIDN